MIVVPGLVLLLSFIAVGAVTLLARRRGLLDRPGARSSHEFPTPTGGGIGFMAVLCLVGWWVGAEGAGPRLGSIALPAPWVLCALPLAALLAVMGLVDDRRGLPAWPRLALQVLAAGGWLVCLDPLARDVAWFLWPLLFLALVWTMNAFNFMDGSHGLAGGQGLFTALALAWAFAEAGNPAYALAALCLAAACAGFLPWNSPVPRVFMGDAGSVPLGFLLGALCIAGGVGGAIGWPVALMVLIVFHVDAGLTLLARMRAGERWYTAHKRHVYQRLIAQGRTHGQVLLLYAALNLFVVAPGVVLATMQPSWAWGALLVMLSLLSVTWYAVSLKLGEGT